MLHHYNCYKSLMDIAFESDLSTNTLLNLPSHASYHRKTTKYNLTAISETLSVS